MTTARCGRQPVQGVVNRQVAHGALKMPRKPLSPPESRVPSLTLSEAARRYGMSARTLRRWVASGRLPAWRVGPRLIRVAPADVATLARPVLPTLEREAAP